MMKRLIDKLAVAVFLVLALTMQKAAAQGNGGNQPTFVEDLAWTVTFDGASYDAGADETTYTYSVCSVSAADWAAAGNSPSDLKDLSHWGLTFSQDCPDVELSGSHQVSVGQDGSIPNRPHIIKWDHAQAKFDPVCKTYTLVVGGFSEPVDGEYLVKAGRTYVMRSIQVPGCPSDPPPPTPSLSINDASGRECDGPLTFQVCLSEATDQDVTVAYATSDSSAIAGSDYTAASGTLTIPAGQTCVSFQVGLTDDNAAEGNETFAVTLSNPNGATVGDGEGVGTIENCEPTISISDASGRECDGPLTFEVCLSEVTDEDVTVAYATSDSSATAGSDYTAASGTVTIPAGQTCVSFQVGLTDDNAAEGNETFAVTLSNPSGATVGDGEGVGTIENCEPTISISDASGRECDGPLTFEVCLSEVTDEDVTVAYATSDSSATAGSDYTAASGSVTIPAGQTCVSFQVGLSEDTDVEGNETFTITLSNPVGAPIGDGEGTGTIEDCAPPSISIFGDTVGECDGSVAINVCLDAIHDEDVTVDYLTSGVTATEGVDYVAASGTLTIPAGQLCAQVTIQVNVETDNETDETFVVTLSNPGGAIIAVNEATITIEDCTVPPEEDPTVVIADPDLAKECEDEEVLFTVTLSKVSTEVITVNYATQDVSATAGLDYQAASGTLTFQPGETSKIVTISLISDEVSETPELFRVVLTNPIGALLGDAIGEATVQDCDDDPTAVELVSFEVEDQDNGSLVFKWETASEFESAGFHLLRSANESDQAYAFDKITDRMILAKGSTGEGATYEHIDKPGYGRYLYELEETELDGNKVRLATLLVELMPTIAGVKVTEEGIVLTYPTVPGWEYTVEYVDSLDNERVWAPLEAEGQGEGRVVDREGLGMTSRMYRLTAVRE